MRSLRYLVTALLLFGGTVPARAADPVAESMFQEAVALMRDNKFADACPKLEASHKIEPKSGTLITLGNCNEQIGKTATAWAQYKEAIVLARQEGRDNYATKAADLGNAIEPKLSKLRIDAAANSERTVTLDGKMLLEGTIGTAFAIDPGTHTIAASAPGKQTWATTFEVRGNATTESVTIPELSPLPPPAPAPAPAPVATAVPAPTTRFEAAPRRDRAEGGVPTWAWIAGGAGLVSLGVSIAFAVDQASASTALDDNCGGTERAVCPSGYDFKADHARETRDFGLFLGFGIGGLALVGAGVVGIVSSRTPGKSSTTSTRVAPWVGRDVAGVAMGFE